MGSRCEICGKAPGAGMNVSHSNRKTHRRFRPNLQTVRIVTETGAVRATRVCTRCIRSGKIRKAS